MNGRTFVDTMSGLREKITNYDKKIIELARKDPYAPGLRDRINNLCDVRDEYIKILAEFENAEIPLSGIHYHAGCSLLSDKGGCDA